MDSRFLLFSLTLATASAPQPAAIELAHLVAGATIACLLAEQGANVIKVQAPIGDWVSPFWLDVNWTEKRIRARVLRDFVERPWARMNIRGAADVPETN